jgi:5,5'-dehydrodivanillate O-demethylase
MRQADNELITRVGLGTPAGELLRRYWHPVAPVCELTAEKPTKRVRLLAEDLVVYRMPAGPGHDTVRYGLIDEHCAHRAASLAFGRVECDGIRCPYHGWKYASDGKCIQQPPEPVDYHHDIRLAAYPVERLAGLLWAYMGPKPAPLLPRWDVLAREDGKRWLTVESVIDCNWLQPMENSVDPSHLYWLHGYTYGSGHLAELQYEEKHEFTRFEHGIQKRRVTPGRKPGDPDRTDEHPLVFPCSLRHVAGVRGQAGTLLHRHNLQIRVPLDDTHTMVYRVNFIPTETDHSPVDEDPPIEYRPLKDTNGVYDMTIVGAQDSMAWETQGAIADRTKEHLGAADRGIVMFRRLLMEQIDIVRKGGEPMCIVRDPDRNRLIELPVINERIGLFGNKERANGARVQAT